MWITVHSLVPITLIKFVKWNKMGKKTPMLCIHSVSMRQYVAIQHHVPFYKVWNSKLLELRVRSCNTIFPWLYRAYGVINIFDYHSSYICTHYRYILDRYFNKFSHISMILKPHFNNKSSLIKTKQFHSIIKHVVLSYQFTYVSVAVLLLLHWERILGQSSKALNLKRITKSIFLTYAFTVSD